MTVRASNKKIAAVDASANITYSLVVGTGLDLWSGISGWGLLASRSYATLLNSAIGGPYGWWREKVYRISGTDEESHWFRKNAVEIFAVNAFHVPVYSTIVAVGSLASNGYVKWEDVRSGAEHLALVSPFIGPTSGWYIDRFRAIWGIKPAAEGAYGEK